MIDSMLAGSNNSALLYHSFTRGVGYWAVGTNGPKKLLALLNISTPC